MLLIPGIILALITVHLMLVWYQKHTQYPGPGRTEKNVRRLPVLPGLHGQGRRLLLHHLRRHALLSAFAHDQPDLAVRALQPRRRSPPAPSPTGTWASSRARCGMFPDWETHLFGLHRSRGTCSCRRWSSRAACSRRWRCTRSSSAGSPATSAEHHLLDRPRNVPTRTGLGVMSLTFYLADPAGRRRQRHPRLHVPPVDQRDHVDRSGSLIFVHPADRLRRHQADLPRPAAPGPRPGAARPRDRRIIRLPHGEMIEVHEPISDAEKWELTQHDVAAAARDRPHDRRQRRAAAQHPGLQGAGPGVPVLLRGPGRAADARRGPRAGVQRSPLTAAPVRPAACAVPRHRRHRLHRRPAGARAARRRLPGAGHGPAPREPAGPSVGR